MSVSGPADRSRRLGGVDAMRLVAFAAVCFIHTARWGRPATAPPDGVDWLTLGCRFCVPFFFLASGYFAASGDGGSAHLPRFLRRIGSVFLVWATLYIALTPGGLGRVLNPKFDLLTLIDGGPGYHLWFLPALAVGMTATRLLQSRSRALQAVVIGAAWLAGGVAVGSDGRIGLYAARYLSAIAYVAAAAAYRAAAPAGGEARTRPGLIVGLVLSGLLLTTLEGAFLASSATRSIAELEFPLGAAPLAGGVFLAALAWTPRSGITRWAGRVGRATLGLYAAHLGVAMLLFSVLPSATLLDRLWVFVSTVTLSIVLVEAIRRTPLAPLVR